MAWYKAPINRTNEYKIEYNFQALTSPCYSPLGRECGSRKEISLQRDNVKPTNWNWKVVVVLKSKGAEYLPSQKYQNWVKVKYRKSSIPLFIRSMGRGDGEK